MSILKTRLYIATPLIIGTTVLLEDKQIHKLRSVLRLKDGANLTVFNQSYGEYLGEVRRSSIYLISQIKKPVVPRLEQTLILGFSIIKYEAMATMLRQATELGVEQFQPIVTARSMASTIPLQKLYMNIIKAAEQCGRLTIPTLHDPLTVPELLQNYTSQELIVCNPSALNHKHLNKINTAKMVLIGPEGGWSDFENESFSACLQLNLNSNILRCDTAAITAINYCQFHLNQGL